MARNQSVDRFRRLTKELQQECLQAAHDEMQAQAGRLVGVMKSVCPVGEDEPQPGLLRSSIGFTWGSPPKTRATGAFRPKGKNNLGVNVYAGNDEAFYARWVEFGTAPHSVAAGSDSSRNKGQGSGIMHPGAKPKPFFWPSYRLMKKTIRSSVKRKLTAAIKKRSAE